VTGEIEAFWKVACVHARLTTSIPSYFGVSTLEVLPPPSWAFGNDPHMADALLGLVLAGTKTATSSALAWYDGTRGEAEELPVVGQLSIIVDGRGSPRALVTVTEVQVVGFDDVDARFAAEEGEGDQSLEQWRTVHEQFFRSEGTWAPGMKVVCERFRVLHQA
jgi:uncharacterized protein YhfF